MVRSSVARFVGLVFVITALTACGGTASNNPNAMDCSLCEGMSLQDSTAVAFTVVSCTDVGGRGPTFSCACTLSGSSETVTPFVYEREGVWICEG